MISNTLLNWYARHKRELPWREDCSPYKVWLSEVILQQTRVDQGLEYYRKFVTTFPTVSDLAKAPEEQVLKLWQGLGYYSRARNLHAAARCIVSEHSGQFPSTYREIVALKGIGPYTAAAIASICFNLPHAVVDGNVYRVLSRLFAIDTPIDSSAGKKQFQALADELLDAQNPGDHNQAMMELGALVCTPKNPGCDECPLQAQCQAFAANRAAELPVKARKLAKRDRYFNYVVVVDEGHIWLQKRTGTGIWQNLFQFPLLETETRLSESKFLNNDALHRLTSDAPIRLRQVSEEFKHILSHQRLFARFWLLELPKATHLQGVSLLKVPITKLEQYPVPRLIEAYLETAEWLR